jgi:hypothetical protein
LIFNHFSTFLDFIHGIPATQEDVLNSDYKEGFLNTNRFWEYWLRDEVDGNSRVLIDGFTIDSAPASQVMLAYALL